MNKCATERSKLLPYETVKAASEGDPEAVSTVLRHYGGYIATLSTKYLYDDYGQSYLCVDDALRHRLEVKLIAGLLMFRAA